jgi:hypothetical protein
VGDAAPREDRAGHAGEARGAAGEAVHRQVVEVRGQVARQLLRELGKDEGSRGAARDPRERGTQVVEVRTRERDGLLRVHCGRLGGGGIVCHGARRVPFVGDAAGRCNSRAGRRDA